jgi:HEAT repeat protein
MLKPIPKSTEDGSPHGNSPAASLPSQRIAELINSLEQDFIPSMRVIAAMALGNSGSEAAVPALSECLKDPDAEVREAAAGALGRIGSEAAVPALGETLKDFNYQVRETAKWALDKIK